MEFFVTFGSVLFVGCVAVLTAVHLRNRQPGDLLPQERREGAHTRLLAEVMPTEQVSPSN